MSLICSECGLDIDCREVFNPVYATQWTLFEHAKTRRLRAPLAVAAAMPCISALLATLAVLAWLGPHLVDDLGIR